MALLTTAIVRRNVPASPFALYVRQVPTNRQVLRRPALSLCAAALGGVVLLPAATLHTAHAEARQPQPQPPAHMSTVGGDRLGQPGTQVDLAGGAPGLPADLTARAWIISDAETGEVLAAHNAHWQLAPASTLKMLFADTVLPKFPRTQEHTVAPADLAGMGDGSSLVGIKENLPYTVQDLWRGVFLRSGNDAVHVLASMNGGVAKTVAEMQQKADDLQAGDTHVVSPDGYDMAGQVSSAYDLSLFARAGLQNADFRDYCSTVRAQFPGDWKKPDKGGGKGGKNGKADPSAAPERDSFTITNTDRLLSGDPVSGLRPYPGIAGVKNGYTSSAGNTYTGVADHDGVKLLVTVMHPEPGGDRVYREAAELLDWGFQAAGKVKPVGTLVAPKSAQKDGKNAAGGVARGSGSAASAGSGSGSTGMWTAAGVTGGALVLLAALAAVVRKRWPLPAAKRRSDRMP